MTLPAETAKIFEQLSRGQFINSHSANPEQEVLYRAIEMHFEALTEYFAHIEYQLVRGENYFYLSRKESKSNLEDKLQKLSRYLDILDFFISCDPQLRPGSRFLLKDCAETCEADILLKRKLKYLETKGENIAERIKKIADAMLKENFFELENEERQQYRVLAAFQYLLDLVHNIQLEDLRN